MKPEDDVRETPPELFTKLNQEFRFTLDVCATHANAKCARYFTESGCFIAGDPEFYLPGDGLSGSWRGERVWCNPPFSDIGAWVAKAWESDAELVVMLLPATRTEQPWWQELVEPFRESDAHIGGWDTFRTRFLPGRHHFLENGKPIYQKNDDGSLRLSKKGRPQRSSPKFGCCLLIWRR